MYYLLNTFLPRLVPEMASIPPEVGPGDGFPSSRGWSRRWLPFLPSWSRRWLPSSRGWSRRWLPFLQRLVPEMASLPPEVGPGDGFPSSRGWSRRWLPNYTLRSLLLARCPAAATDGISPFLYFYRSV